jgi:hypothetical protein
MLANRWNVVEKLQIPIKITIYSYFTVEFQVQTHEYVGPMVVERFNRDPIIFYELSCVTYFIHVDICD